MPTTAQQIMIADGLPAAAIIPEPERKAAWAVRARANPAPEASIKDIAMKTETATKPSKADQVASLRVRKAEARGRIAAALDRPLTPAKPQKRATSTSKPKAAAKKAAKARTLASPKPATPGSKVIRPGSKLAIVVGLLTRKQGCTAKECMELCNWPSISMQQQARAAGLTLRQEKDGRVTRYWGT